MEKKVKNIIFLIILFTLFFLRFFHLDADPSFLKRVGDIQDEGYWTHNARVKVLFDNWFTDDMTQALFVAPLYSVLIYGSFKIFGVTFFAARFVSAFFSILTLILLYYFVKHTLNKNAAHLSMLVLGLNNFYLIYNRIALVETTLLFFIFSSTICWYYREKSALYILFSALFFCLAILTKLTAIYFIFFYILYLIADLISKKRIFQQIVIFTTTTSIILLSYLWFIFIPNWPHYKIHFLSLIGIDHKSILEIMLSPLRILTNNFFSDPSVSILSVLFFLYFLSFSLFDSAKEILEKTSPIELFCLFWIVGALIGLLLRDMHDRRFIIFLVPFAILIPIMLEKNKTTTFQELASNILCKIKYRKTYACLWSIFFTIVILSPVYTYLSAYLYGNYARTPFNLVMLIITAIIIILIFLTIQFMLNHYESSITNHFSTLFYNFILLFIIIHHLTFLITFSHHLSIMTSSLQHERIIDLLTIITTIFLTFIIGNYLLQKNNLWKPHSFIKKSIVIYFILTTILITLPFLYPSFSLRDASRDLNSFTKPGEIITGSWSNQLSIESKTKPYFYSPDVEYYQNLNQDTKQKHNYVLISKYFNGKKQDDSWFTKTYQNTTFIKSYDLYPYPNGKVKNIIEIYKINQDKIN